MNKSTRFELRENQEIMSLLSTIYDFYDGDGSKLLPYYLQCSLVFFNELRPFAKNADVRSTTLDRLYESWRLTHRTYYLKILMWRYYYLLLLLSQRFTKPRYFSRHTELLFSRLVRQQIFFEIKEIYKKIF